MRTYFAEYLLYTFKALFKVLHVTNTNIVNAVRSIKMITYLLGYVVFY